MSGGTAALRPLRLVPTVLLAGCLALPPTLEAQAPPDTTPAGVSAREDRTSLSDVYRLARQRNPRIQAAHALADARGVSRSWAGLLPDPRVQLGMMNLSLPGFHADMPSSMAPSVQVVQAIPFPGKLGLEDEIAERTAAMAVAGAEESWWTVRARAGRIFWELYAVDRRLEVLRDTRERLEDFEIAARALYESGTVPQTDVLQAQVEVARTAAEIARLEASRRGAAARLNALLDRPTTTPVPEPWADEGVPRRVPSRERLLGWADMSRPAVERDLLRVRRAETRSERAAKEIWPDLTVGGSYGQRSVGGDVQRMASFTVGFRLPIFAGRRQLRQRDEAAAKARMARAELAETRAEVDARVGELVADLDRARELVRLYRVEVLPQARAAVESAYASYRTGTVDFRTLVNAQTTLNRYEDEFHRWVADYGSAVTELEAAVGRELPRSDPIPTETR